MDLRYPIGHFSYDGEIDEVQRATWIQEIEAFPALLKQAVQDLTESQLDTPYRDGGWTVRQVVHHLADSHMNSLTRFKLAMTEEIPTIRPYYEDRWAELEDSLHAPISLSLVLLDALHRRWGLLLKSLTESDYSRTFYHPESKQSIRLDYNLGLYVWHGKHHLAHITSLIDRMGWH